MKDTLLKNAEVRKLFLLLGLFGLLFWPALTSMFDIWMEDSNNSHGLLVPFIVAYLIYEKVNRNATLMTKSFALPKLFQSVGLVGLIGSIGLLFLSVLTDIAVFKHLSCVTAFQSLMLYLLGWGICLEFAFPLFFLFFMIPIPTTIYGAVALPMQLLATKVSVFFLSFSSLPISADGNIIRIGDEMLTVAEACSGLRSLMSFIIISLLFSYLAKIKVWKKGLMVALSIPVAIVGNILRIIILTFVAYIYGAAVAVHAIHDTSGYVMFVVAFGVFFWLARTLEESEKKS